MIGYLTIGVQPAIRTIGEICVYPALSNLMRVGTHEKKKERRLDFRLYSCFFLCPAPWTSRKRKQKRIKILWSFLLLFLGKLSLWLFPVINLCVPLTGFGQSKPTLWWSPTGGLTTFYTCVPPVMALFNQPIITNKREEPAFSLLFRRKIA